MFRTSMIIVAASALLFTAANAQPMFDGKMAEKLKLTDQQIEQMQTLKIAHQKQMVKLRSDLALAKIEMKEIMMKDKIDERAALAKQDKISSIKAEIAKAKLQHRLEARKVLTEEQRAQARKMMMPGMKHRKGGPGRGCCGMGPMGPMGPGMMEHGMKGPGMEMPMDKPEK